MSENKEVWKQIIINGNGTDYHISNHGRVRNSRGMVLSPFFITGGINKNETYLAIRIRVNNKRYSRLIHRLVALAFIPNPDNKPQVNHKDGNKENNYDWNLEWNTRKENMKHAAQAGLLKPRYGSTSPFSKHTEIQIHEVCKLMEKGGLTVNELSSLTGVSTKTINGIFRYGKWAQVSSQYDIKIPIIRKPSRTADDINRIDKLIIKGYRCKKIIEELGLPDTNANLIFISRRINTVKASTTIESSNVR